MLRIIALLLCCLTVAVPARAADTNDQYPALAESGYGVARGPGGWGIFDKGVRLKPYTAQPVACDADNEGVLSMTAAHRLCLCDGKMWRSTVDDKSCQWGAK